MMDLPKVSEHWRLGTMYLNYNIMVGPDEL